MSRRVLVFAPYYPPFMGGIANHGQEFATALFKQGVEVITFAPSLPYLTITDNDPRVIWYPAVEPIKNFPVPCIWRRSFWHAWKTLKKQSYQCLITRTRFFPISVLGWVYARQHHLPWMHIEHGSAHVEVANPFVNLIARLYDELIGRFIFRTADTVVSISKAVQLFVARMGRINTPLIYRGLDMPYYDQIPASTTLSETYPNKHLIVWTGRMYAWKGVHHTLTAMHRLSDAQKQRFVFLLIGDGPERPRLEKLAQNLPVVFLGAQTRETVIAYLKEADAFIHSSLPGGGLSTSLLEAMYCANAIIASPHEGAKEIVINNKTGYLSQDATADALFKPIQRLLDDPEHAKKMAQTAHKYIKQHFSWNRSVDQYLKLLDSLS